MIVEIQPQLGWKRMSETSLTLCYTQIDCPIIIGWNVFVRECEGLSIRGTQIRVHDDAHKVIEFIGNLMASNNIALLDTFLNRTEELWVFFFLKCDPRIVVSILGKT